MTGFGIAAGLAIGKTVVASSNLEEQTDRTRDQFGKFAGQVIDQSNLLGTAFGLAKKEVLESASVLSAIFESAGFAGKGVADLSVHFVKLATDLSRFANIPFHEALRKIESGLVGQVRPLREVGVALSETATDAFAYAHGIAAVGAELTDSQKIQSRAGFIAEALTKSWGNLAKTGDKVAGAIEGAKGRFENLSATIGDSLLLVAAPALGEIQIGLQAIQTAWAATAAASIDSSSTTVEGLTAVNHTIGPIQSAIGSIGDTWQNVGIAFKATQTIIVGGLAAIGNAVFSVVDTYAAFKSLITGTKVQPVATLKAAVDSLNESVKIQLDEFKQLQAAPATSDLVNAAFAKGRADIQAARDKLLKMGKLDVLSIKPTNLPAVLGKEHKGFAPAAIFGEPEAANALLRARFGQGGPGGPAEKTANNTARTNVLLEQIRAKLGAKGEAIAGAVFDAF